jgi:FHS family L-fucose permease-like MFS transporter
VTEGPLNLVTLFGPLSGILCSGIVGGAIVPLIIGLIADSFGLCAGMCLLYLSLSWVLAMSFWTKPMITNERIGCKEPSLVNS